MTVARVATAGLGVAVIEAAATVVVSAVENRVHTFGRIASSCAAGGVVAVAGAGRHEDTVRLLAVQRDRCPNRAGQIIVAIGFWAVEAAGWSLGEMITTTGLIVNNCDEASRAGAEGVLASGIGDTSGGQWRDGGRGVVGAAFNLVQGAGKGAVQGSSGAVRGDACRTAGGIDVAWSSGDKGARGNKA